MEGGKGAELPGPHYCPMTIVGAKWISGSCEGESGYHNIQAILGNPPIQRRYVRPRMHLLHHVQLVGAVSISPTVRSKTRLMTPARDKGWQSCIQTPGLGSRIDSSSFCCVQASHLPWCGWSRAGHLRGQFPFEGQFKRDDWIWITSPRLWVLLSWTS